MREEEQKKKEQKQSISECSAVSELLLIGDEQKVAIGSRKKMNNSPFLEHRVNFSVLSRQINQMIHERDEQQHEEEDEQ